MDGALTNGALTDGAFMDGALVDGALTYGTLTGLYQAKQHAKLFQALCSTAKNGSRCMSKPDYICQ